VKHCESELCYRLPGRGLWDAGPVGRSGALHASANACLIDNSLATNYGGNGKSGYNFDIAIINKGHYVATGAPITVGSTGVNGFCSFEDGVVRKDAARAVNATEAACGVLPVLGN